MKTVTVLSILMLNIFACTPGEPEIPDGGPCSYSYDTVGVVLVDMDTLGDDQANLEFVWCNGPAGDSTACDSLDYYQQNGSYALMSEVSKGDIKVGDTLAFVNGHITNGSCNPDHSFLLLKKFRRRW